MENLSLKIFDHVEKFKYLEEKKDINQQILNNRIKEIKEEKERNKNNDAKK